MWHPYFDGPGGPQPRDPKRASRQNALNDLKQEIIRYPGVKCIDMVDDGHHAFGPIREGRVNTIFIDPFGLHGGIEESTWIILCIRRRSTSTTGSRPIMVRSNG
jgi:hypothetical protein